MNKGVFSGSEEHSPVQQHNIISLPWVQVELHVRVSDEGLPQEVLGVLVQLERERRLSALEPHPQGGDRDPIQPLQSHFIHSDAQRVHDTRLQLLQLRALLKPVKAERLHRPLLFI